MKTNNKKGGEYTSISKSRSKSRSRSHSKSKSKSKSFKDELISEQLDFINKLEDYYSNNLGHPIEIKNKKIILSILELKEQIDNKEGIIDNELNTENYHKLFDIPEEEKQHKSIHTTKPKNEQTIRITTIQESMGPDGKKKTRIFYPNGKVYDIKDNIFSRNLPSIMTRRRIAGSKTKSKTQKKKN